MKQICPTCGATAGEKSAPFCSTRCADRDLARWFSGSYAVPAQEEDLFDPGDEDTDR